jgi:DNA (cytosine-5)-methyltransferase 1
VSSLVLSLFPGIGLLDMAFEEEGFCVVRGPDLLWGGDIRRFHPPAGAFQGVIGGPPCQMFSRFRFLNPAAGKHGNMIPEFERIVDEARPDWFVMENVPDAPTPAVDGYVVGDTLLNNRWLGEEQDRKRRFSFGSPHGYRLRVEVAALETALYAQSVNGGNRAVPVRMVRDGKGGHKPKSTAAKAPTVSGGHGAPFDRETMSIGRMCELQGLPEDFLSEAPFTAHGKRKVIGNGVPLPMGRAIAKAVKAALKLEAA